MSTPFQLNPIAQAGFTKASAYDTHRPSYPAEAVSALLTHLNIASVTDAKIVELGSGTGLFTRLIAARDEKYEILAVEPHREMREELIKKTDEAEKSRVKAVEGNAEDIPIEDEWADAVIASQSFHWFATAKTLKEISRVLTPGGSLGIIYNVEDYNAPKDWIPASKWEQILKDIIASLEDGSPRFRHMKWKDVFDDQQETTPLQLLKDTFNENLPFFSLPLGEEKIEWKVWLDDEAIWQRYATLSQIANLKGQEQEDVKRQVLEALKDESTEIGRNEVSKERIWPKLPLVKKVLFLGRAIRR